MNAMRASLRGARPAALPAAVALLLCCAPGCGVLNVDVDVYKGPLANHEHIQTQQAAALAIGAKPLLIELRDRLEWGAGGDDQALQARRRQLCGACPDQYYAQGFIPADENGCSRLKNDRAIRVNAVLALYEDQVPDFLRSYLGEAQDLLDRYLRAWDDLKLSPQDGEYLDRVRPRFETARTGLEALRDPRENLYKAYEGFLHPKGNYRRTRDILEASSTLRDVKLKLTDPENLRQAVWQSAQFPAVKDKKEDWFDVYNLHYQWLQNRSYVEAHAVLLFPSEDDKAAREEFVDRVTTIARAYCECRETMRQMIDLALRFLEHANGSPEGRRLAVGRRLTEAVIRFAAEITDSRYAIAAVFNPAAPKQAQDLREALKTACGDLLTLDPNGWKATHYETARGVIADLLRSDPARFAPALRAAQDAFRRPGGFQVPTKQAAKSLGVNRDLLARYEHSDKRRYGLARYPMPMVEAAGSPHVEEIKQLAGSIREYSTASGLEGGRLCEGIETLTERYLKAHGDACNRGAPDAGIEGPEQRILMDALARFAQKILFMANTDELLRRRPAGGWCPDEDAPPSGNDVDISAYVQVLQAVGNSILVQVDALRERREHKLRLKGLKNAEVLAANRALAQGTTNPIALDANTLPADPGCRDTMDAVIAVLRHEYAQEVRRSGKDSPSARQLRESLDVLYEQRSGMVYLEPTSLYLRTSFPATGLQRDASIGWRNMLLQHGHRAMWSDDLAGKSRREMSTIQEIDKQFWQNVNRVRVAGTGLTNYVIAKDDVGNWYVKNYSADPNSIIQAARGMASFAAGTAILPGGGTAASLAAKVKPGKVVSSQSVLARQFVTATDERQEEALRLLEKAKDKATGLPAAIARAWATNSTLDANAQKELTGLSDISDRDEAARKLTEMDLKKDVRKEDAPARLVDALEAIRAYYERVANDVTARKLWTQAKDGPKMRDAALASLRDEALRRTFQPLVNGARRNADSYRMALGIIGKVDAK